MYDYPQVVAKITDDYLARVNAQLRLVPFREREEFLREIKSHIYEAYQQGQPTPAEDDVARILAVLRNLGEPAEVVSDRLPGAMVRSGTKRNLPLHLVGGIVIALFGIPLGFGGVGVLVGVLITLAGVVAAYFATVGMVLLTGALLMLMGLTRIYQPEFLEKLVTLGILQMDLKMADLMEALSPSGQGFLMILFGCVFVAAGAGMLWLGRYLIRGLRFLFSLAFEWLRRFAASARRRLQEGKREARPVPDISYVR